MPPEDMTIKKEKKGAALMAANKRQDLVSRAAEFKPGATA